MPLFAALPTAAFLASNVGNKVAALMTLRSLVTGVVGIVYLIASHFVVETVTYVVSRVSSKEDTPESLKRSTAIHFMKSFLYWIIMCIATAILFVAIGIEGAAVITILGSVLLAIGLGLQGTLSDMAAGIMLMMSNAFSMGNYIEVFGEGCDGVNGTVVKFNILYTTLVDDDSGVSFIVPNRVLYSNSLKNHSTSKTPVVVDVVTISNKNLSIAKALETLRVDVQKHALVLKEPKVSTNVSEVTAKGTDIEVRYPLAADDYYTVGTRSAQSIIKTLIRESLVKSGVKLVVRE
eukprot:gene17322-biopygen26245